MYILPWFQTTYQASLRFCPRAKTTMEPTQCQPNQARGQFQGPRQLPPALGGSGPNLARILADVPVLKYYRILNESRKPLISRSSL